MHICVFACFFFPQLVELGEEDEEEEEEGATVVVVEECTLLSLPGVSEDEVTGECSALQEVPSKEEEKGKEKEEVVVVVEEDTVLFEQELASNVSVECPALEEALCVVAAEESSPGDASAGVGQDRASVDGEAHSEDTVGGTGVESPGAEGGSKRCEEAAAVGLPLGVEKSSGPLPVSKVVSNALQEDFNPFASAPSPEFSPFAAAEDPSDFFLIEGEPAPSGGVSSSPEGTAGSSTMARDLDPTCHPPSTQELPAQHQGILPVGADSMSSPDFFSAADDFVFGEEVGCSGVSAF